MDPRTSMSRARQGGGDADFSDVKEGMYTIQREGFLVYFISFMSVESPIVFENVRSRNRDRKCYFAHNLAAKITQLSGMLLYLCNCSGSISKKKFSSIQ